MTTCSNCSNVRVELLTCSRCHAVAYCSPRCQRESWKSNHGIVCRQKIRLGDEIPSEIRDKPWAHEYLAVREFLTEHCRVDAREIKQLSEDDDLVHELYAKITKHLARSDLMKAQIASIASSTETASANQCRIAASVLSQNLTPDSLPPSSREALMDLRGVGDLLPMPSPPLPHRVREAVVCTAKEIVEASEQSFLLNEDIRTLKRQIFAVEKKESRHLIDPAVVTDKAKGYKALQNDIIMLEKKGSEYESRIMKMTKELKHAGLNDKLTHERIIADADALALKQEEIESDSGRVSAFHGLPANLPLAKVALEEKKRKLSELKEETDRLMD